MLIKYKKVGITGFKSYWLFKNVTFKKNRKLCYKKIDIITTTSGMTLTKENLEKNQLIQILKLIRIALLKDRRF